MQSDPSKQGFDNYGNTNANQYPPMNQPQFGTGNVYPPTNAPPAYSQYPQQPAVYPSSGAAFPSQAPLQQQQGAVVVPVYGGRWNNLVATPVTSDLKKFFILSGILSLIFGIADIGLEVGINLNSYSTYYRGFWAGGFLIGSGICMLIAAGRAFYVVAYIIRMFAITLILVLFGLILSIINLIASDRCDSYYWHYCDKQLATNLKIGILALFVVSLIQTVINIVMVKNAQRRATLTPAPNVPGY